MSYLNHLLAVLGGHINYRLPLPFKMLNHSLIKSYAIYRVKARMYNMQSLNFTESYLKDMFRPSRPFHAQNRNQM